MADSLHHQHCCQSENQAATINHQHHDVHAEHEHGASSHWALLTALCVLALMLVLEYGFSVTPNVYLSLAIYLCAYLLAGYDVLKLAAKKALHLDFFNEFVLMSVATIGAFAIGSFSEGVAVMVFYSLGEWFQESAVSDAKRSIKNLLDSRPDTVTLVKDGKQVQVHAAEVAINSIISVKTGEKIALDGILQNDKASFDTAALTGESVPRSKRKGDEVLAGMISTSSAVEIKTTALFKDSKLSQILNLVQEANSRKSKTQLFISKFAKIYTPIVFALALALLVLPYLFINDYVFKDWLYRALVFLVISCPCALVVSIPLGYFGGIGLASKHGILFKGANFIDAITEVDTVMMDKTGTLTEGVFEVQEIKPIGLSEEELLGYAAGLEQYSSHPIAKAILQKNTANLEGVKVEQLEEIAGHGLKALVNGKEVLVGNFKLLDKYKVAFEDHFVEQSGSIVAVAVDGIFIGQLLISDAIKPQSVKTIKALQKLNIPTTMLTGDRQAAAKHIASELGIATFYADLLPQDKIEQVELAKKTGKKVAFMGDGLNDAPVITLANVGLAMGGLGSDAAIETADIVIQNDNPYQIVNAIKIGKITKSVVWQNIALAAGVKILVLALGAGGVATLWEAVIADVGVALLAILNAVRIQKKKIE